MKGEVSTNIMEIYSLPYSPTSTEISAESIRDLWNITELEPLIPTNLSSFFVFEDLFEVEGLQEMDEKRVPIKKST